MLKERFSLLLLGLIAMLPSFPLKWESDWFILLFSTSELITVFKF